MISAIRRLQIMRKFAQTQEGCLLLRAEIIPYELEAVSPAVRTCS